MKRIEEELRVIRQQMEEDYLLHAERISAQNQSIERVERALESVQDNMNQALTRMRREFQDFSHTNRSYQETLAVQGKRNMRLLDIVQAGLVTSGLEAESRLDKIEQRLTRLEEKRSGAA